MSLEDLYKEIILEHYKKPRNRAPELEPHDVLVHHSNPLCGDEMDLRLRVGPGENGADTVEAVAYDGDGCSISMSSASAMTEAVTGRELGDALDLAEEVPAAHALGRVVGAEVRRVDRARLGRHDDGRRERGRSRRARSNE